MCDADGIPGTICIDTTEEPSVHDKPHLHTPAELELRQDDVLRQLEELNSRLERVLIDVTPNTLQTNEPMAAS